MDVLSCVGANIGIQVTQWKGESQSRHRQHWSSAASSRRTIALVIGGDHRVSVK
ncbi:MAG: hypothetical protein LBT05_05025 [Planctomycetaceae bacterium]|nr:hypothetical protein [Planctomycetaceae bacterium]